MAVISSQAFSCTHILSTSDLPHATPNFAERTDSIHSRCLAGFPRRRYPPLAVDHETFGRRGTKKHRPRQCLCMVSLCRIYRLHRMMEMLILWTVREERGANTEPTGLGMERWCAI